MQNNSNRIFEIDLLRVLAILFMLIFHTAYDLNAYAGIHIDCSTGIFEMIGNISGLLFIFVSGISSGLSRNTNKKAIKLLIIAMIISIVSYIIFGESYIRFGILHLLSVCLLTNIILKNLSSGMILLIAFLSLIAGEIFKGIVLPVTFLIPLGIVYDNFQSIDYYPVFPYVSYYILGIFIYKTFYHKGKKLIHSGIEISYVTKISKKSLLVYLIHQPIIIITIECLLKLCTWF